MIVYHDSAHGATVPEAPDTITLLSCSQGVVLAKRITPDGKITDYDSAKHFTATENPVPDFHRLAEILRQIASMSTVCVVRGALVGGPQRQGIRRLLHDDPKTGDAATLRDVPRRWLALDVDKLDLPAGVDLTDLTSCAQVAIATLPSAFHGRRCLVQATASHGLKPGIRLRLWFWLSRPTSGRELKAWLRGAPVDHAVFSAAQAIYTAAPVFGAGVLDHLPERCVMLPGVPVVAVPLAADLAPSRRVVAGTTPPARTPMGAGTTPPARGRNAAWRALRDGSVRVTFAEEGERHATLVREALRIAPHVASGALSADLVQQVLTTAIQEAGREAGGEVAAAMSWALARERAA
jgi:hypothetical protein